MRTKKNGQARTDRIPGGPRDAWREQHRVADDVAAAHHDNQGRCSCCGAQWPCSPIASAALILDCVGTPAACAAPRVWWPCRPNSPLGRVWTVRLSTWQTLWADLDIVLDSQLRAWDLPEPERHRREALALAIRTLVTDSASGGLALALVRLGPATGATGAGVWLLPVEDLPPIHTADDFLARLHDAWTTGVPIAGDPPRLPLIGPAPARRPTAPTPAPAS
ncbi:hypothetical protein OG948_60375 (plasmid) [Embleya sp. NBC_00888]|uniref:hypothetical protein n=1 Tax=Embleya sp. NBC_00888 TaxID=2975960 RepID=UPI002F919C43|nr:hypothetical protein OG948_60375 [Embleya sp. NBC_00888]